MTEVYQAHTGEPEYNTCASKENNQEEMINKLAQRALECAQKRGKVNPCHPIDVMVSIQKKAVHDEAVELLVARTNRMSEHLPQYTEDVEEAADVVISALTYLAMVAVDVQEVIEAKMKFNESREA